MIALKFNQIAVSKQSPTQPQILVLKFLIKKNEITNINVIGEVELGFNNI